MRPAILFDLDGTLVDSAPDLHEALNELLAELGRPPVTLAQVRQMTGHGAKALIGRALAATGAPVPPAQVEDLYPRFIALYTPRATRLTRPYPEVVDTLARLADDHPLAVVTNKPEAPTREVLDGLGLARWFRAVVGGDTLPVRKPDPAPLRLALQRLGHAGPAVMIGDSEADVRAAAAACLPCIAVCWGYSHGPVEALGADAVARRFGELPERIAQLRPGSPLP